MNYNTLAMVKGKDAALFGEFWQPSGAEVTLVGFAGATRPA
jgi:hypothetical protein